MTTGAGRLAILHTEISNDRPSAKMPGIFLLNCIHGV